MRLEATTETFDAGHAAAGPATSAEPRWLAAIAALSGGLNRLAAVLAGAMLVAMTALILVEIGMRFFSRSTYMADVFGGYGVAAITFIAAPWALEQGSMIRVTVITDRLPGLLRRLVEGAGLVAAGAILWFLLVYEWSTVARFWSRGTMSQHFIPVPLWIPEAFFAAGLVLMLLQVAVRLLRLCVTGRTDDTTLSL
ncbi:TRAP transporter small permease [Frigidibacter sp. MR17.24]|uniref:TRAP transporter small permease n=1 Tax=Frigidibacter sp. MR17.24 TaxID=3127345 RepID=UPI003012D632